MARIATIRTLTQFRREVERQVRTRAIGTTVVWDKSSAVRYPTGLMGYRGYFHVTGAGLTESVRYVATYDKNTDGPHTLTVKPLA